MKLRLYKNHIGRRLDLEKELNLSLEMIGRTFCDDEELVHCENCIGAVAIPVGIAGTITIHGANGLSHPYIPLATTEGALVASVNRGCKVIRESGGTTIMVDHVGVTRGPVFEVKNIQEGREFSKWIQEELENLDRIAQETSAHLKLKNIYSSQQGKYVYVRFQFDTDQAMGMNMVTIATTKIAEYIESKNKAHLLAVAGNFDTDKKPSWLNMIEGRGRKIWGEVIISEDTLKKMLHVTPRNIEKTVIAKCWGGSIMSGSMGFNAHFANIVAAFFAATGQDLAHISEGSLGVTSAEVLENGDLYFSVYLPDILLGIVGGGTKLKTQTEARMITKTQTSDELAEVLGAAVLAGELSLIASIAEGSLAKTHEKLGR
ncbi:MAG: hydroxymethylglutaryl-CoA reductase [Candidatus Roizmanbacteria bacterium]|nr:hydroxymethylglutaryl-CoA reductase [Candidatus Roizmanbacteria bacterium]